MFNSLQGVPKYERVVIVEDENKDYTLEKHIPTLKAKDYVPAIVKHTASQNVKLEKEHSELKDKYDALKEELDRIKASISLTSLNIPTPPSSPSVPPVVESAALEAVKAEVIPGKGELIVEPTLEYPVESVDIPPAPTKEVKSPTSIPQGKSKGGK